jgi:hypothetical protein
MIPIFFNTKSEGIDILSYYFIKIKKLNYYLENNEKISFPVFFQTNVYEPEDIEFKNLFLKHLKLVIEKVFYISSELNFNRESIRISFVSSSIYWDNLFVIKNNIFVSTKFLTNVFELIEYDLYKDVENIYINNNEIYDIELLKSISKCIYYILQNLNQNAWIEFITSKFNCNIVPISNIIFKNNYNILQEPNIECMYDNIIVYWLDSNNIYGTFNSVYSTDNTFSPYWEQKIIKLDYLSDNNTYKEIEFINVEQYNEKIKNFLTNIITNPFNYKSTQITNSIIYNKNFF